MVMFAYLPCRFSYADFKSVFKNRLRFGGKWRETKQSTLFISGRSRRINAVMESMRRTGANDSCVAFAFLVTCTRLYNPLCPSVGPSVGPSVHRSVRNAFFSNPQKRLFLAAEMAGIELVVMRGEEGGGGDDDVVFDIEDHHSLGI